MWQSLQQLILKGQTSIINVNLLYFIHIVSIVLCIIYHLYKIKIINEMELFLMPISDAHLYFSVQVNQVNDLFNTQILVVDYDIDNNLFLTCMFNQVKNRTCTEGLLDTHKGGCQKLLSGFFPLRGYHPPYPLNGKSFCQKNLSGKGG